MTRLTAPLLVLALCTLAFPAAVSAAEGEAEPASLPPVTAEAPADLPDPLVLLAAADGLFSNQGIQKLSARVVGYRDPHDEITLRHLKADEVKPGLVPILGRYEYWEPNHYNFFLLGFLMASSEVQTGNRANMTSPLLPLPGGILSTGSVLDRFSARVSGIQPYGDTDGGKDPGEGEEDCYVLRLQPKNRTGEFFKSLTYYISVSEPHLVRGVRATFSDGGTWTGTGYGSFYYKDYDGRRLPFIGQGVISFQNPSRQMVIKGKWRDYAIGESVTVREDAALKSDPYNKLEDDEEAE